MSEHKKTVTFTGEIRPGVDRETMVANMVKRLRITTEQAQKIVDTDRPMKLKRGLSAEKALTYQKVLEGLGLTIVVIDDGAPLTAAASGSQTRSTQESEQSDSGGGEKIKETEAAAVDEESAASEEQEDYPTPVLALNETWFSPGVWGWITLIGTGLLVATSALIEALIVRDETIPMDASTLHAGAWALGGVLSVALVSYFLGWMVWLLRKKKPGGGQMVFCLTVLVVGAVAIWINAEKLDGKLQHVAAQRANIIDVQTAFGTLMTKRADTYSAAAEKLALDVGAISRLQHIDEMRSTLAAFRNASAKLGVVQLEGDKILAARLSEAGVESRMVDQFLNGYRSSASANHAFNAATRQYEAEVVKIWVEMLDLLESSWGRWEPDPQNSTIRTEDVRLQESYNSLVDQLGSAHRSAPQATSG